MQLWIGICLLLLVALDVVLLRRWQRGPIVFVSSLTLARILVGAKSMVVLRSIMNGPLGPIGFGVFAITHPLHFALVAILAFALGFHAWSRRERIIYGLVASINPLLMIYAIFAPMKC